MSTVFGDRPNIAAEAGGIATFPGMCSASTSLVDLAEVYLSKP
jgi:hypothetical protein